ncbi:MAG: rRNA maturation RNase YbeY [Planctomycetaceae bacterium]|nr:rRNA maturation RNase YbeY [Planctomycetaceae bacterium]
MTDGPLLVTTVVLAPGVAAEDVPEPLLRDLLDRGYRSKRKKPAALDLLVTTDGEIARLNRRHLGRDEATDVLAFMDGEMEDGRVRLGDIAISADTARRVATERGIRFTDELAFYALHGLLHLLGMDDGNDKDRAEMQRLQAKIMKEHGIDRADELRDRL